MAEMLQLLTDKMDKTKVDVNQNVNQIRVDMNQKMNDMDQKICSLYQNLLKTTSDKMKQQIEPIQHQIKGIEDCLQRLEQTGTGGFDASPLSVAPIRACSTERNLPAIEQSSKAKIKVPTFDGEIPWELYKSQFEVAAHLNGWNEELKAGNLIVSLRGAAQQLLFNIANEDKWNYQKLIEVLEQQFGQTHLVPIKRRELKYHCQARGENLQVFASEVLKLARQAYPGATLATIEQTALEAFVDGIFNFKVQSQV